MRLRALAVTTALALAATGLTACTSKIGQAAVVGSHRISQKDVDQYVNPAGPTAAGLAAEQSNPVAPRQLVVNTLVRNQILLDALRATPQGVPSAATIHAKYEAAVSEISQGQATGGAEFDKELSDQLTSLGLRASFAGIYVKSVELQAVLADQSKATTSAQLLAAITKAHDSVSVSPRFGTWDPSQFSLSSDTKSGRPPFVTIGTDTQSTAPSSGQ